MSLNGVERLRANPFRVDEVREACGEFNCRACGGPPLGVAVTCEWCGAIDARRAGAALAFRVVGLTEPPMLRTPTAGATLTV